jgi:thiol-disulfide isomerase/thioredoxin
MRLKLVLLLCLCSFLRVSGQGLKVGDRVPEMAGTVRFSDYKDKLLVLDFWATWCAPCRAMVPVMDSLRRVFNGQVVFLPVAYESRAVVDPVLASMHRIMRFDLPEVYGDQALGQLFPHRALPHEVWIKDGVVRAITEYEQVTAVNLKSVLDGGGFGLEEKKDVVLAYDKTRPFLVNGNGGDGTALVYHSILSGYVPGLSSGLEVSGKDPVKGQRFSMRNNPFLWFCRLAYADSGRWFPSPRVWILSKDSGKMDSKLSGQAYLRWLSEGNGWCYELQVPPALSGEVGYTMIRTDIARLFPAYKVGLEHHVVPSLVLVRLPGVAMPVSSGGDPVVDVRPYSCRLRNASLSQLLMRLERQYLQNSSLAIADGTGYTGRVDLDIQAPLSDVKALNQALLTYGLALVEKPYLAELLVIRDK